MAEKYHCVRLQAKTGAFWSDDAVGVPSFEKGLFQLRDDMRK